MADITTKFIFKSFSKDGFLSYVHFNLNDVSAYTDNNGTYTFTYTQDASTEGLEVKLNNIEREKGAYFCSYIKNVGTWYYKTGDSTFFISLHSGGEVIIPMFYVEKNFNATTLKPKFKLISSKDNENINAYISYSNFDFNKFPPKLETSSSTPHEIVIKRYGLSFYNNNCTITPKWPNDWTSLNSTQKTLVSYIEYNKPFRLTSDCEGNNIIATTNVDNGTYTATLTFTPNPDAPYYTKSNEPTTYFVTKPYNYHIIPINDQFDINEFRIEYKDNDANSWQTITPGRIKHNENNFSPIILNNTLSKNFTLNINAAYIPDSDYFCPYTYYINTYHFSYIENSLGHYNFNGTQGSEASIEFKFYNKNDTTLKPKIKAPTGIPENSTVKYSNISGIINSTNRYQYNCGTTATTWKDEISTLGRWAKYGFNAQGKHYQLELTCGHQIGYTYDFDVWCMSEDWKYPRIEAGFIEKGAFPNGQLLGIILPQNTTYFEYFNGTITPYFEVYPRTLIEYEVDKSFYDNNTYLSLELFNKNNIVEESTYILQKPGATSNGIYTTEIYRTSLDTIYQQAKVKVSEGNTPKNPISYINIERIEYNSDGTPATSNSYVIQNPISNTNLFSDNETHTYNTWRLISSKYKFTMVTLAPPDPTEPTTKKQQFGLKINTDEVEKGLKYTLSIADSNFNFTGVNNTDCTTGINAANNKMYNSIIDNTTGTILLIDDPINNNTANSLNFNLYLSDALYYVPQSTINITFSQDSNDRFSKFGTLWLKDYIFNNKFYRGKNQIKLAPLENIPYEINMSIFDNKTNKDDAIIKYTVNPGKEETVTIDDKYSDCTSYILKVNSIKATIGGNQVDIPRYNFNLVDGSEPISYLKKPAIQIVNNTSRDMTMHNFTPSQPSVSIPGYLGYGYAYAYVCFDSYITRVSLNYDPSDNYFAKAYVYYYNNTTNREFIGSPRIDIGDNNGAAISKIEIYNR